MNTDPKPCAAEGCGNPEKRGRRGYCEKHFMRLYRNGTTALVRSANPILHTGGYRLVPAHGHFLARGSSHAYEHRLVYHATHGDGPFRCHWCSVQVSWDDMHVDHLDDDKLNNAPDNLVAACAPCNQGRGRGKAPITWRAKHGIAALGKVRTLSEWSRETGLSRGSIKARLDSGMPPDEAMTKPRGKFGPVPARERLARMLATEET